MEKDCPRCGSSFGCNHNNKSECRCASVRLDEHQYEYVRIHYPTCLCGSCREEVREYFYAFDVNPRYKRVEH